MLGDTKVCSAHFILQVHTVKFEFLNVSQKQQ